MTQDKATLQAQLDRCLAEAQSIESTIRQWIEAINKAQSEVAQLQTKVSEHNGALGYSRIIIARLQEDLKAAAEAATQP